MSIEVRDIADRDEWLAWRREDVTASAAAALLGAHPYQTALQLWAEKTGHSPPIEASAAMERGIELEPLARKWIARENPTWTISNPGRYYRDTAYRLGATPDAFAEDPARPGIGVIQIKSVEPNSFRRLWHDDDGALSPPLYAVIQAMVEADLTGASWAAVAALVISYGIDVHVVEVPLHRDLMTRVRTEAKDFWHTIEQGRRPGADWKRDAALIAALYQPAGVTVVDMSGDNELPQLCDQRVEFRRQKKEAEKVLDEVRAKLIFKLDAAGAAAGRLADGRIISAKRVNRPAYNVNAASFVDVRVKDAPLSKE